MGSQNGMDELEVIDADSQKVAAMLSALPRVEAPANFDFRVRGGIAQGAPPSRSMLFAVLKTAAPLALILLVVSLGLFYYEQPTGTEVGPINSMSIAQPDIVPAQPEPSTAPTSEVAAASREVAPPKNETAVAEAPRNSVMRRTSAISGSSNRAQGGGSVDRIIHPANVIMPPGTEAANPQKLNANSTVNSQTDAPVREILDMIGLEGDFADGGWKVRSVKANSLSARAKFAAGDVIESIDGQPVKKEMKLKGSVTTFTVRRGGKLITLSSNN